MATDESNSDINWTKRKEWGAVGLTHRLRVVIGDVEYSFAVDQPVKGQWVGRGWRNGDLFFYRAGDGAPRTLAGMKEVVERQIGQARIVERETELAAREDSLIEDASMAPVQWLGSFMNPPKPPSPEALAMTLGLSDGPDEPECWCEWVDIGVGMQRVTDNPECEQHNPGMASFMAEALTAVIDLRPAVVSAVEQMAQLTATFRTTFYRPPCGCPTPTHRMSCGVGAVPRVL
jgi:hypothetical protein